MSKGLVIGMKDTPNLVPVYNGNNGAYNHGTNGYRPQPQQQQQPQAALKSSSGSSRAPMTYVLWFKLYVVSCCCM